MSSKAQTLQTIVFADIAGSTRLYEQLGDVQALALVSACLEKINVTVHAHHGKVVKTIGDEVMCTFALPDHAASAAVGMHESICSDPGLVQHHIRLRIGLHHGPAINEDADYFGDAVNIAARMVALAKAGQIITNRITLELMSPDHHNTARLVDQTQVKGKYQTFELFELSWGQPEELTMVSTRLGDLIESNKSRYSSMTVTFASQSFSVNQTQPVVSMGRDNTNHVVVDDPKVSRLHARIEMRKNKFVLVDQSTNGTYFLPDKGEMVMLRRDEAGLLLMGQISLGEPISPSSSQLISYRID